MSVLVIVIILIAAYLLMEEFLPLRSALLKVLLAFFFSLAFTSICFLFSLFLHLPFAGFCVILLLLALSGSTVILRRRIAIKRPILPKFAPGRMAIVVLACLTLFTSVFFNLSHRWGGWDNWAIWSLHARFLADENNFTNLFTNRIAWTHPDYPLMLPSYIALLWKGHTNGPTAPLLIAFAIAISLPLLLLAALREKHFNRTGLLLFGLLTLTAILFPYVNSQYADSLLAVFFLLPFALLSMRRHDSPFLLIFLIGFFSASAGLIKNEGLPFFLLFSLSFLFSSFKHVKQLLWYACGAALPLLLIATFKLAYAPPGDLFTSGADSMAKLNNGARYSLILEYFVSSITGSNVYFGAVLVFAMFMVPRYFRTGSAAVLLLMLACYFFIYLITPNDLNWHLSTSFDRLLHQLFPALLYTVALMYCKQQEAKNLQACSPTSS